MAKGAVQARKKRARKASKEMRDKRPYWKAKLAAANPYGNSREQRKK